MEILLGVFLGIGLSAACGFRVFVPLCVFSIAALSGNVTLSEGFRWIGTYPALAVFATATVLEIAAYYIPWLDNVMDSIAAPAAAVAGTLIAASSIVHMSPLLKWVLAIIAGGGTATIFHGVTSLVRGASTATTGGLSNPVIATAELGIATGLSILSIALPLVGIIVVLLLLFLLLVRRIRKLFTPGSGETHRTIV